MAKLPKSIKITIKDFKRFYETNKFQKTWNYLKLDLSLRSEWRLRGLKAVEAFVYEYLILIAFKRRDANLEVIFENLKESIGIDGNLYEIFKTLERYDFIEIHWGKVIDNNIKKDIKEEKASAETISKFLGESRRGIND